MNIDKNSAAWIETVALGLVAAFLFQSGLLLLLFLVPLQFLWVKRGPNSFFVAAGVTVAGVLGTKIVQAARLTAEQVDYVLLFADMLLPVALVAGLYIMNFARPIAGYKLGSLYRLLVATAAGFIVTAPLVFYMSRLDVVSTAVGEQLQMLDTMLGGAGTGSAANESVFATEEARGFLTQLAVDVFYGTYVSGIAMVVALDWYVGHRIARKYSERTPEARSIRVPAGLVWPFVVGLGLSALTLVVELGFLKYVIWNATIVLGLIYAVQGWAIARHLLARFNVSRGLQFVLVVVAVMVLFVPGVNLLIVLGLPGLGLSETWIRYNRE